MLDNTGSPSTLAPTAAEVALLLQPHRYSYATEADLHDIVENVLISAYGFAVKREVRLSPTSRIDLLVERVGVEVKVAGSAGGVLRQLMRYAADPMIDELVLVTTRRAHIAPADIGGVPVRVVVVNGDAL